MLSSNDQNYQKGKSQQGNEVVHRVSWLRHIERPGGYQTFGTIYLKIGVDSKNNTIIIEPVSGVGRHNNEPIKFQIGKVEKEYCTIRINFNLGTLTPEWLPSFEVEEV